MPKLPRVLKLSFICIVKIVLSSNLDPLLIIATIRCNIVSKPEGILPTSLFSG